MKPIDIQIKLEDVNDDYKTFVNKFKPKKTTDDCYTPDNIYQVVKEWACKEYGIDPEKIVRPFWPGCDYERYPYKEGDVVLDNPPFSILGKIVKFYTKYEIPFFLFAPYLTNFSTGKDAVQHIIQSEGIVYENGAEIGTSFLTNMDEYLIRSVPDLTQKIKEVNNINRRAEKKEIPKYCYPDEVLTATAVGYMCAHGVDFRLKRADCFFIREINSQKQQGKGIFGGGFLLSEKAAAERAAADRKAAERKAAERAAAERKAAEREAAERAAAIRWELSEGEKEIIKSLGGDND